MDDPRAFVADNAWEIGAEYIENDITAHSGTERPKCDALREAAIAAAQQPCPCR
ncbi:hypothetical protein GCM10011578_005280 [Streptomyces fuscichromogenes]|uniref:Uncharacterized protein n=1 Tax=Streptomyces fuscichromogenes TaxID=1324013 RepID=A0A917X8C0_9ACTN|nr:hypothetical protein GCM10011578_005280 [Streptomyces fuscichromogenes]